MATKINLRRAPKAEQREAPYHHGGLRDALIGAAQEILEDEGLAALSLRAVARRAGVSPAAPYHHFPDKQALLDAVAERGFDALTAAMTTRMDKVSGAGARLDASDADVHDNARVGEPPRAGARDVRVGIERADHDAAAAGVQDGVPTRRRPPVGV